VGDNLPSEIHPKFQADLLADAIKSKQALNWILDGYFEDNSLALLVGPVGQFKTFLAIDWAMSIASGVPWLGCRVTQRPVLYIAGEGRSGVVRRMRGWLLYHGRRPPPLYIAKNATQLLIPSAVSEIQKFLDEHHQSEPFIVLDTLARNFGPGNENSTADMSIVIATLDDVLRVAACATVLIVHHVPLESISGSALRSRGSSALPGAADTIITCRRVKGSIVVHCDKQKEADPPPDKFLADVEVELDQQDNFGNPITTCVLTESDTPTKQSKFNSMRGIHQRSVIRLLRSRAADSNEPKLFLSHELMNQVLKEAVPDRKRRYDTRKWLIERTWLHKIDDGYEIDTSGLKGD